MKAELAERLRRVRLLALDVDGVLTDGTLYFGESGELFKAFHVHDGLGVKLLASRGVPVAVVSAKRSAPLERRLDELGVSRRLGRSDKVTALGELVTELDVALDEVAYAGDDLIDLPVMRRVGLAIAVPNARPEVLAEAHWVTHATGGRGAVREIAEAILRARGELDAAIDSLLG